MFLKRADLSWEFKIATISASIDWGKRKVNWNKEGYSSNKGRTAAMLAMFRRDLWKYFPSRSSPEMIDWNIQDNDWNSAPMLAVAENDVECVRMLSKIEGIDWNFRNRGTWPKVE